jgi:hypothetical protein
MDMLFDPARHQKYIEYPWNEAKVRVALDQEREFNQYKEEFEQNEVQPN